MLRSSANPRAERNAFERIARALLVEPHRSAEKMIGMKAAEHQVGVGHGGAARRVRSTRDRDRCRPTAVPPAMRRRRPSTPANRRLRPRCECRAWAREPAARSPGLRWWWAARGVASSSATSVDVPPMSKLSRRSMPARRATLSAPVTPPAGPDKMVRTGSRAAACAERMPPEDCMMLSRAPRRLRLRSQAADVARHSRQQDTRSA